jgi:hypothetical protein
MCTGIGENRHAKKSEALANYIMEKAREEGNYVCPGLVPNSAGAERKREQRI